MKMNKEIRELARDLFLKRCVNGQYLTEQNQLYMKSLAEDCVATAELFYEVIDKEEPKEE